MPAVGLVAMVGAAKAPEEATHETNHGNSDLHSMPAVGLVAMVGAAKAPEEATHETNHGNSDLHSMPAVGLVAMVGAALHELAMPPLTSPKPPSAGSADVVHCLTMPPPLIHAEPPSAGSEDVVHCLTMPLAPICGQAETRTRTSSCAR
jgi:hypothetical protein